jgi:protein ImuB
VVTDGGQRPAAVNLNGVVTRVTTAAGPWRMSGEWWDGGAWARDEWDVALANGLLCRLARDLVGGRWQLDGVYD